MHSIIWHEILRKAIIHTFAIVDLLDACDTTPAFAAMLRVDTVGRNLAALKTTTVARLEEAGIALTPETVTVIARLCKFVGLTARSPLKQLEHLVNPPRPTAYSPHSGHRPRTVLAVLTNHPHPYR